jgi:hypothetical protein
VDVFTGVDDSCKVVEILRGRFAIAVVDGIGNHHRRAAGREVHARPLYLPVVLRILSVKDKVALGLLQRLFDNRARHPESAIVTEDSADRGAGIDAMRCCLVETDFFENAKNIVVDGSDIHITERFVLPAGFSGIDRLDVFRQRCTA